MISKLLLSSMAVAMCLTCISCSTFTGAFTGYNRHVIIDGDVLEPVTIKTKKRTYTDVLLPTKVKVSAFRVRGQHIAITSRHYEFSDIVLEGRLNPWYVANLYIGGLVGMGVDAATGTKYIPSQNRYYIKPLEKKQNETVNSDSINTPRIVVTKTEGSDKQ